MKHTIKLIMSAGKITLRPLLLALLSCGALSAQAAAPAPTPDGRNEVTRLLYDANGNLTGVNGPSTASVPGGRLNYIEYDALGRPVRSIPYLKQSQVTGLTEQGKNFTSASGTTPIYGSASYSYDSFDRKTTVKDPSGLTTTYAYDGFNNLLTQYLPDSKTTSKSYDSVGRLSSSTDAKGNKASISYDEISRPKKIDYYTPAVNGDPALASTVTISYYDSSSDVGSKGKLHTIKAAGQEAEYKYDNLGRISKVITKIPYNQFTTETSYSYNDAGQSTGITYPSGRTVNYEYKGADKNRVSAVSTSISNGKNTQKAYIVTGPGKKTISYRPFGGVIGIELANGLDASRSYDKDGRLLSYPLASTTLNAKGKPVNTNNSRNLDIDAASHVAGYTHPDGNAASDQAFAYDELDRLKEVKTFGTGGTTKQYGYDNNGNRSHKVTVGAATDSYTPDMDKVTGQLQSNRVNSIISSDGTKKSYSYDANGNIISDGIHNFIYDYRNRLSAITTQAVNKTANKATVKPNSVDMVAYYEYNANGQRVYKSAVVNGKGLFRYFHYDLNGKLIAESDNWGRTVMEYLYFGNLLVALVENKFIDAPGVTPSPRDTPASSELFSVQTDHLGAPRVITNAQKAVVWSWADAGPFGDNLPSGNPADPTKSLTMNLRFPGQYFDAETGLYHNGFRDYNPELGRYMQADPIGLAGGSWSTYAYAGGNPVSNIDPDGRVFWVPVVAATMEAMGVGLTVAEVPLLVDLAASTGLASEALALEVAGPEAIAALAGGYGALKAYLLGKNLGDGVELLDPALAAALKAFEPYRFTATCGPTSIALDRTIAGSLTKPNTNIHEMWPEELARAAAETAGSSTIAEGEILNIGSWFPGERGLVAVPGHVFNAAAADGRVTLIDATSGSYAPLNLSGNARVYQTNNWLDKYLP